MSVRSSSPFRHVVTQDVQLFAKDRVGSIEEVRCRLTRQPRQDHFHLTLTCYQGLPGSEERSHRESPRQNLEIDCVEHSDVGLDLRQCVGGGRLGPPLRPTAFHACVHDDHALGDKQVHAFGLCGRPIRSILGVLLPIEGMVAPLDHKNCEDGSDAADSLHPSGQVSRYGPWWADNRRQCSTPHGAKTGDDPIPLIHRTDPARSSIVGQSLSILPLGVTGQSRCEHRMDGVL